MGVAGLWDILRPAGEIRSLTHLAVVDGFEANQNGHRAFRVGIDASIWFFHAAYGKEGENPELRTLFFRCSRLMSMPFLPLFVFDGPKRPSVKRGKRVSGNNHWLTTGMKNIINAFGFEWRTAPGEAEAELAYLNRIGVIDAVLSDDVDNFLFGALTVVRNPSNTLSGNRAHPVKNSAGKDDGNHVVIYKSKDILEHPKIKLTHGGAILIGLLSGGDYHQAGLTRCGPGIAHGLAKCGFGDTLLQAVRTLPEDQLSDFLITWRHEIRQELKSNSQGHIGRKNPSLAKSLPEEFPDVDILLSYANPITSESGGKVVKVNWDKEPDLGKIAALCELYFEWGVKDVIIKRFRTVLWPSAVLRILRRAVLDRDQRSTNGTVVPTTPKKHGPTKAPPGTPSSLITKHFSSMQLNSPGELLDDDDDDECPLIVKIHSTRTHASTDGLLEYRLEIAPALLVRLAEAGIKGIRPPIEADSDSEHDGTDGETDVGKSKKGIPKPESHMRVWIPASIVRLSEPGIVEDYEEQQVRKQTKKVKRAKARPKAKIPQKSLVTPYLEELEEVPVSTSRPAAHKLKTKAPAARSSADVQVDKTSSSGLRLRGNSQQTSTQRSSTLLQRLEEAESDEDLFGSPTAASCKTTVARQRSQKPVASRSTGKKPRSALSTASRPRPFPLMYEDVSDDEGQLQPIRPSAKRVDQGQSDVSTDSASYPSRVKKSPRKSATHASPRTRWDPNWLSTDMKDRVTNRSPSPSPARRPVSGLSKQDMQKAVVIEISSDSDAPPARLRLPPLVLAKRRALDTLKDKPVRSAQHQCKPDDFIDLT
ncbi:hypothetical protein JAAARDRAFT_196419 [Jaapia argillacea MUCL 33604]|uniref:XPG-I domain-containing protein n=1 Tax=Jaapia argillacea MUCL 33604 TaxID=933084 RepID=A0A067PHX7_9AGAM|nr:hypothetical protein JAAARDRAFT_196419 [Jaapia argillacea MUCL 33604]